MALCMMTPPTTTLSSSSSSSSSSALDNNKPHDLFSITPAAIFSVIYLVSCIIAYLFSPPFEGIMKITTTLGFLLALSVLSRYRNRINTNATRIDIYIYLYASVFLDMQAAAQSHISRIQKQNDHVSTSSSRTIPDDSRATPVLYNITLKVSLIEQKPSPNTEAVVAESKSEPQPMPVEPEKTEEEKPSETTETPSIIPFSPRFIAAEKGNVEKGRQRYENTLKWRRENNIDQILREPQPHFHAIKKCYPQYFHGRSKEVIFLFIYLCI
jgi:hypothetical protein